MPCSIRGSAMAVLDIESDSPLASPVRKPRRLGVLFLAAVGWILLIGLGAIFAGALPIPSPTDMDMLARRALPSAEHWLGTDHLGRDMFSRLVYGARVSLIVGFLAPVIGVAIGAFPVMLACYFRGRVETFTVGACRVSAALPARVVHPRVHRLYGPVGVQHHAGDRRAQHSRLHPRGPRRHALAHRARVRGRGSRARRHPQPHPLARALAQRGPAAGRLLPAGRGRPHRGRGCALLPGGGRAAAGAELGQHDRRGPREPRHRPLARLPAGPVHVPERALLQYRRRHAARAHRSAPGGSVNAAVLSVEGVSVELPTPRGALRAVDKVDLALAPGHTLGIVGESGCGKTMLSRAILQLLPKRARLTGRVMFAGRDLVTLEPEALRRLRGPELAVVFQDPMTSLNPVLTIGTQIVETLQAHVGMDAVAAFRRGSELLAAVGIPAADQRMRQYPHQLSGGMRQRVAIAIALSCEPKLLIADEPTTALDVTIQAQILDLLAREQRRRHMAMIIITHDLGVVAGRTDEVAVMYAGRIVERAPTPALFKKMRMPYTEALLAAIPKLDSAPHTVLPAISGRPPDPTRPLKGCSFSPRCRYAVARCHAEKP